MLFALLIRVAGRSCDIVHVYYTFVMILLYIYRVIRSCVSQLGTSRVSDRADIPYHRVECC